jgi:hypothetical protein
VAVSWNCSFDEEHGVECVFKGGSVAKVGPIGISMDGEA